MAVELVDGFQGKPHVTADDVGGFKAGVVGSADYVLNTGKKLEATVISNNKIRIAEGEVVMQGRHWRVKPGTYEDLTIDNGTQGMNRKDAIVARYTKESSSGIENVEIVVLKGTPVADTPTAPVPTKGDIRSGALVHEMLLYIVEIKRLNVESVTKEFNIIMSVSMINKSLSDISDKFGVAREDISKIKYAVTIHRAPQENYSYAFHCGSIVPLGNIEIPTYSKGMFISNGGNDGVLFAIDVSNKLYIGFRNGANWNGRVI